jgi:cytochrome c oxidase assembly protein subunit 15
MGDSLLVATPRVPRAVIGWLFLCCALVFAMIVVGGVTRVTHSGLSITEWQPIIGTLPPLSETDWQSAFDKYRQTPEYREVNRGMTLAGFKGIFWWEYVHRLLGRLIGVVWLLPLLWFAWRRRIPEGSAWKLGAIFVLGGLQGAMGWYMVQSGLVDDPRVSQFRLAAHLALAFVIFGAMFWVALSLLHRQTVGRRSTARQSAYRFALAVAALVLLQVVTGGLVAGIHAGSAYNTFPLMNGAFFPAELFALDPWWRNFFWNMATVQFDHRLVAYALVVVVVLLWWKPRGVDDAPPRVRRATLLLLAMLAVQIGLGIATLLLVVPPHLAATHQAGAVLVFAAALNVAHSLR